MDNPVTRDRWHFEDLELGRAFTLGPQRVTAEAIKTYAGEFDPLPFHLDEAAAKASILGGLAASGFHTAALSLRMLVEAMLSHCAAMGGLGFEKLSWRRPLMAGDSLGGVATIIGLRRSASNPHMGIVNVHLEMRNQNGQEVMAMTLSNIVEIRHPHPLVLGPAQ
ncbi:MAG: MaoC family dehydratase [Cucumibacter sp.]